MTLLGARRVRELLAEHAIHPTKALGQNFVIDPNTIRKVVAASGVGPDDAVLEIGAGLGSLTLELARVARRVTALEVDGRVVPALREVVASASNVELVTGDALEVDLGSFDAGHVVANLPYNIAASVVLRVLETAPGIHRVTVMTQKEVGERLGAAPGSRTYGGPSILVAYWGMASIVAPVSRRAFYPEPNVDSVIVAVDRRDELPEVDRAALYAVVKAAFGQRRKTMRNSLADLAGSAAAAARALEDAGLEAAARPEHLGLDEFVRLTRSLGRARRPAL